MGSQRVRHDLVNEQQQIARYRMLFIFNLIKINQLILRKSNQGSDEDCAVMSGVTEAMYPLAHDTSFPNAVTSAWYTPETGLRQQWQQY